MFAMKHAYAFHATVFLLLGYPGAADLAIGASPPFPKPNILLIIADDLGYGDVQCLNPQRGRIPTPHLDRLATQGMTFTDAHSGSSVCTPTRYGLLTGRYAWRTRLQAGVLDGGNDEPLIAANRLTVAGFLQQQGYYTACIGKWHLGFRSDAQPVSSEDKKDFGSRGLPLGASILGGPVTRGFDYFWGCSNARTMSSVIEHDQVVEKLPPVEMLPQLIRRVVDQIGARAADAKSGRPFFLYVPLTSPHTPIVPAPAWQGKSPLGPYGDFVMQTDAGVGSILAALDEHDLADETLVLFTSDNGCSPQAGTTKLEAQGHFASASYRGYKADIWEGGHRVPFFVRWPGRVQPGAHSDRLVCLTDFLATCADILSLSLPATAGEDSVSFLPALTGVVGAAPRGAVVHHSIQGRFSLREGPWKLNFCAGSGGWSAPSDAAAGRQGLPQWQLYDLIADPAETINLYDTKPEETVRLAAVLSQYITAGRSTPGPPCPNDVLVKSPFPPYEKTRKSSAQ
jgi:arylsulfatase A-like enzyme